jgi:hypothetical protein
VKRLALLFIAIGALLVGVGGSVPGIAGAAPAAKVLGQNPIAEGEQGGCACSAVQLADTGTPSSYVFPFSGVLTKAQFYVGTTTEAGQWVKAQTFRTSGPADATVISQGEQHNLNGLASGAHMFLERIPAVAGDVLGARFNDSPLISDTPAIFKASPSDLAGRGTGTEPGGSFTATTSSGWRVNAVATLEPDEDGDGYGDSSQDLCPGSPIVTTACSGTLFGSGLVGMHSSFTNCGFACLNIQKSIGGQPTAAAQDGVVVRWRLLGAETGTYRVRVLQPGGGNYTILHSSEPGSVTTEPQLSEKISTFATRLPIPAGGYVALAGPTSTHLGFRSSGGFNSYEDINDHVVDGAVVPATGTTGGELLYDADIEPDADHDGYGDVTQDSCPSNGSTQGACPPSSGGGGSGSGPKSSPAKKPEISGLKATPSIFRVKQGGAAISARSAHAGTTLKLTLSEEATVSFTLQKALTCKGSAKASRCAAAKSASPLRLFSRLLPQGKSKILFSGLYKAGKKVRALKPGSYTLTAVATNAASKASAPSQAKLTVVGAPSR